MDNIRDTISLKYKAARLKFWFYLRSGKRIMGGLPFALFFISFLMFLIVMVPELRLRLRDSKLLVGVPSTLIMTGTVLEQMPNSKGFVARKPVSGIVIEGGGFRTYSNSDGSYSLQFVSRARSDIPVVVHKGRKQIVIRVDFPAHENYIRKDIIFP